jgi:hypothetical protein
MLISHKNNLFLSIGHIICETNFVLCNNAPFKITVHCYLNLKINASCLYVFFSIIGCNSPAVMHNE